MCLFHCIPSRKIAPDIFVLKFYGYYKTCGAIIYKNGEIIWYGRKTISDKFDNSVYINDELYTKNISNFYGLMFGMNKCISLKIKNVRIMGSNKFIIHQMNAHSVEIIMEYIQYYRSVRFLEKFFGIIEYKYIEPNMNKATETLAKYGKLDTEIETKTNKEEKNMNQDLKESKVP
jgi:hypothetical protein